MSFLSNREHTEVGLGSLASLLLPMICKDPANAYAHALHMQITKEYGQLCVSRSDVSRSLKFLESHSILRVVPEDASYRNRTFYKPTWIAGLILATVLPMSEWDRFCIAPVPRKVRTED